MCLRGLPVTDSAILGDHLLSILDDSSLAVVIAATQSLGLLKYDPARDQLFEFLTDLDPVLVKEVISALGSIGPADQVGPRLVPFVGHMNDWLHGAALSAIGRLKYTGAVSVIVDQLEACCRGKLSKQDVHRGEKCIDALVKLDAPEAGMILARVTQEASGMRLKALKALVRMRSLDGARLLEAYLPKLLAARTEPSMCLELFELMRITNWRAALPAIRSALGHPDQNIRERALGIVVEWGDRESLPVVRELSYCEGNPFIRMTAVKALPVLGDRNVLLDLLKLAGNHNPDARRAATETLKTIPDLPVEVAEFAENRGHHSPASLLQLVAAREPQLFYPWVCMIQDATMLRQGLQGWQGNVTEQLKTSETPEILEIHRALSVLLQALGPG